MTVGLVGAGSWGTTLAVHLAGRAMTALLGAHGAGQREAVGGVRDNRLCLAGGALPRAVVVVDGPLDAVQAPVVVIATPTQFIRPTNSTVSPQAAAHRAFVSL